MADLQTLLSKFLNNLYAGLVDIGGTSDALLVRDAANVVAERNGTNAQKLRIYKTFTDVNNFQSLDIDTTPGTIANITTNWAGSGIAWDLQLENSFAINGSTGIISKVDGITAAGKGVPIVVAAGRATAQAAANASVSTFTVGAADGSFEVNANVLVTTATTHTFTAECAYTDEGNTARTVTLSFMLLAGGTPTTSIVNTNGAVPYLGVPLHIRAKAATTITIRTQAAGTYTTVAYNVEGVIKQTA